MLAITGLTTHGWAAPPDHIGESLDRIAAERALAVDRGNEPAAMLLAQIETNLRATLASVEPVVQVESDLPLTTVAVNAKPDQEDRKPTRRNGDKADQQRERANRVEANHEHRDSEQRLVDAERKQGQQADHPPAQSNRRIMVPSFGPRGFRGWEPVQGDRPTIDAPPTAIAIPPTHTKTGANLAIERRLAEQGQRIEKLEDQLRELQMTVRKMSADVGKSDVNKTDGSKPKAEARPKSNEREVRKERIEKALKEMRARRDAMIKQLETGKKDWVSKEKQLDKLKNEFEAGRKEVEEMSQALRQRMESLTHGQRAIQELQSELQRGEQELGRHAEEAERVKRAITELEKQMKGE